MGSVGILNVGAGDIVLTFDKNNPAEAIRAGRIVTDMLRRGYALLVEVERDGEKCFERALDFDEKTFAGHDEVHVDIARGVFVVIQINEHAPAFDADADGANGV